MQKNVSPVTAVIVILVVIAIATFAWVKYSTGPVAVSREQLQGGGKSGKHQANRRPPSGARRGSGRKGSAQPGGGASATAKPGAKPEAKPAAKPAGKPAVKPETKPAKK